MIGRGVASVSMSRCRSGGAEDVVDVATDDRHVRSGGAAGDAIGEEHDVPIALGIDPE